MAALPHHSWCLIHASVRPPPEDWDRTGGVTTIALNAYDSSGARTLEFYYRGDARLRELDPDLYTRVTDILRERAPYDRSTCFLTSSLSWDNYPTGTTGCYDPSVGQTQRI